MFQTSGMQGVVLSKPVNQWAPTRPVLFLIAILLALFSQQFSKWTLHFLVDSNLNSLCSKLDGINLMLVIVKCTRYRMPHVHIQSSQSRGVANTAWNSCLQPCTHSVHRVSSISVRTIMRPSVGMRDFYGIPVLTKWQSQMYAQTCCKYIMVNLMHIVAKSVANLWSNFCQTCCRYNTKSLSIHEVEDYYDDGCHAMTWPLPALIKVALARDH